MQIRRSQDFIIGVVGFYRRWYSYSCHIFIDPRGISSSDERLRLPQLDYSGNLTRHGRRVLVLAGWLIINKNRCDIIRTEYQRQSIPSLYAERRIAGIIGRKHLAISTFGSTTDEDSEISSFVYGPVAVAPLQL